MHDITRAISVPVLMLSSGYEPLFRTTWKRALSAVCGGRAEVIETYKEMTIGTPSGPYPFPSKVRFTTGVIAACIKTLNGPARLTKMNLYLRDNGECQYCQVKLSLSECTVDHVRPRSRGGKHSWKNVVLACGRCNQRKGPDLLNETNMNLSRIPRMPASNALMHIKLKRRSRR
ncbi:MAG TPA: HNH endonuclease [Flavobacteriales bacterium]|nr:HNH endonuclease [Phycisphaerales bacterium]HIN41402.1 HNH endonuclease [Flavobacteriales bacterium]